MITRLSQAAMVAWLILAAWCAQAQFTGPIPGGFAPRITLSFANVSLGSVSSFAGTSTGAIPAGSVSIIVCAENVNNTGISFTSATDGTNTYTATETQLNANTAMTFYTKTNASAVSSGATITCNLSGANGGGQGFIGAVSTLGPTAIDKHTSSEVASGTSISLSTGTMTFQPEIIVGSALFPNTGTASYNTPSGFQNALVTTNTSGNFGVDFANARALPSVTYAPSTSVTAFRVTGALATFN